MCIYIYEVDDTSFLLLYNYALEKPLRSGHTHKASILYATIIIILKGENPCK